MKNIEEMTDHELLMELVKNQKKNNYSELISAIANTVLVILMLIISFALVPKAYTTMDNVNKLVDDTNAIVAQAEGSIDKIDTMVTNVNKLVEANTEDVSIALDKISQIDIDKLNESIGQLGNVIEPLSKFFSVFSINRQ